MRSFRPVLAELPSNTRSLATSLTALDSVAKNSSRTRTCADVGDVASRMHIGMARRTQLADELAENFFWRNAEVSFDGLRLCKRGRNR